MNKDSNKEKTNPAALKEQTSPATLKEQIIPETLEKIAGGGPHYTKTIEGLLYREDK